MQRIMSGDNKKIKRLKGLERKKVRETENLFFIEGIKAAGEAALIRDAVTEIYVSDSFTSANEEFVHSLENRGLSVNILSDSLFKGISETSTPQGIIAEVKKFKWDRARLVSSGGPLIILDWVSDPGNAGTILRTCEAFGFKGVFSLEGTADIYNPKTVRATMGSILRVPWISIGNDIIGELKQEGYRIFGAALGGKPLEKILPPGKCAVIIGNEAKGISGPVKSMCDELVSIPMTGECDSLNASVAAGVIMHRIYESEQALHAKRY
jgi:RNA methyltransferase, TrmH family